MSAEIHEPKASWAKDRQTITECLRRHPIRLFIINVSRVFTAAYLGGLILSHFHILRPHSAVDALVLAVALSVAVSISHYIVKR